MPSVVSSYEEIDANTGDVSLTLDKPEALPDTIFIALNTLACQTSNSALFNTTDDPGN